MLEREISSRKDVKVDIENKRKVRTQIAEDLNQKIVNKIDEARRLLESPTLNNVKIQYNNFFDDLKANASQDVEQVRKDFFYRFKSSETKSKDTAKRVDALDNLETKLSNSGKILELLKKGDIEVIKGYRDLTISYSLGSNLDQEAFTANPKDVVQLALDYNRIDILNNLRELAKQQGIPLEIPALSAEKAFNQIIETIQTAYTTDDLLNDHPKPLEGILKIHTPCLKMFQEAKSSHIFTGLVHIRNKGTDAQYYKIFLAPIQPSKGSDRDPNKIYPGLSHEQSSSSYTIYNQEFPPLYHLQHIGNNPPRHGHTQLANDLIGRKPKHQSDILREGKYIGFTVIKGRIMDGLLPKVIPISNQSNPFTFPKEDGKQGAIKLPEPWQAAITKTFYAMALNEYKEEGGKL